MNKLSYKDWRNTKHMSQGKREAEELLHRQYGDYLRSKN